MAEALALEVISVVANLRRSQVAHESGNQLLRAGTSVGAKYRAACRSRSRYARAKIAIAEEEADESLYWLELLTDSGTVEIARVHSLLQEANQFLAICTA